LGLQNQPFLPAKHWQAQVSFQYANTNDWYFGDQRVQNPPSGSIPAPSTPLGSLYGTPPTRKVTIFDLDVLYGVTNRLALDLTVPFLTGSLDVVYGTAASHQNYHFGAGGIGDVSLQAEYWLNDTAKPSPVSGSVSLGIKAPTGPDTVTGTFVGGTEAPIDEGAQLGNGGWELLFRAQGTASITGPLVAYGSGYYGMSLNETSNVHQSNVNGSPGVLRGVPDTYSGRLGLAYVLPVLEGLVFSAGGRINGVTVKDIVGGGDPFFRRPGYEVYVEPGLSWTLPSSIASISVPLRVYAHKLDSLLDESLNRHLGSDFAPFLVVASYARRF
jgi:hypothetical protein